MRTACDRTDHDRASPPIGRQQSATHGRRSLWLFIGMATVLVLNGCAARAPQPTPTESEALQAAYRAGLQTALRGYQEQMLDNDFPYTNWSPPLVQRLWMPARITNGVFIPGHMEDVIITPGAWKREFSAPLSTHQSTSQTRPYTHERPTGSADRPRSLDAEADAVLSRSRVPAVPHSATTATMPTTPDWAALPSPGGRWGVSP
jgi:hypothetical protein